MKKNVLILIISVISMTVSKILIHEVSALTGHGGFAENIWIHFNSVPMLLVSFSMLGIFMHIKNNSINVHLRKVIVYVAPATLGIYLFSTQFKLHMHLWTDILHIDCYGNSWKMVPAVFISAVLVFAVCLGLDKLRHLVALNTIDRLDIGKRIDLWQKKITDRLKR